MKLSTLIVKMLNRLIKDKILPREAIDILLGKAHIYVQILCSSSALPKLDAPVRASWGRKCASTVPLDIVFSKFFTH